MQAADRTAHFGKWHLTNRETHGAPETAAVEFDAGVRSFLMASVKIELRQIRLRHN